MVGRLFSPSRHLLAVVLGATTFMAVSTPPSPVAAAQHLNRPQERFLPHRVLYRMELDHAEQGASVTAASGHMYYRFEALCDGWEVETRVYMRLNYGIGEAAEVVETTWSFDSFETFDGKHFAFGVDHNRDGEPLEVLDGEAVFDKAGNGKAHFFRPERDVATMPPGTIFPARHLVRLLDKAFAGEKRYSQVVFDGASINNPYEVNAFIIGRLSNPGSGPQTASRLGKVPPIAVASRHVQAVSATSVLPSSPTWRVRLAYFPMQAQSGVPEFEIQVDYREDGVAEHMVQDFGDFALDLTPSRFETLPYPECR